MARDLTNALLASPNQASTVFGVGGAHPIRQKSLFAMRFLRKAGEGGEEWKNGFSFLVKSVDRPTVQPVVEELNQYNKKRIIHTGVKYSPVTCVLYDTADGAAMNMWVQYAQYYIGDYRQDAASYSDDIISSKMLGTQGNVNTSGYGFGITTPSTGAVDGINTQFFFDRIDVYQVWGGEYTCFQLLNPRINNFDPDDLDYEQSGPAMITVGITYEAIYHENGGKPQSITGNTILTEMFGGVFNGETPDPEPSAKRESSFVSKPEQPSQKLSVNDIQGLLNSDTDVTFSESDRSDTTTSSGGALSKYGDFDFGDFTSLGSNLPSELSTLAGSNPSPDVGGLTDPFPSWVKTTKQANELELARILQSQRRANQDALGAALGDSVADSDLADGVGAASLLEGDSPLDHVEYGDDFFMADQQDSPSLVDDMNWAFPAPTLDPDDALPAPADNDAVVTGNTAVAKGGMSLSPLAIAAINTSSNGRSQIGQRRKSRENPLLSFIVEPKPATVLTPDLVFGRVRLVPVKVGLAGVLHHSPRPVYGPILRPVPIIMLGGGFVTVSGVASSTVRITSSTASVTAVSGKVFNATWTTFTNMFGIAPVIGGTVNNGARVVISSNIRMQTTVAGEVDRRLIVVNADLVGEVKNRAATINKPVPIKINMSGIATVRGTLNKSIKITQNSIIIFPIEATLSKTITINSSGSATHIVRRMGTISKQVTIKTDNTTGIFKQPVVGSVSKAISVSFVSIGDHKQPRVGTINKHLPISSTSFGRVPFFGTLSKPVIVSSVSSGIVAPIGAVSKQITATATAMGSSLVFGGMAKGITVNLAFTAHSTTNINPAHRYWRLRTTSSQSIVGPNEVQFREASGAAPAGTISASSSYNATYAPSKAFDRDGSTWWSTAIGAATGSWIALDYGLGNDKEIEDVLIATDDPSRVPQAYELQYSDDASWWDTKAWGVIASPQANSVYVTRRDIAQRFDARFWTLTNSATMTASLTNVGNDEVNVSGTFTKKDDLAGIIWESTNFNNNKDYRGLTLAFDYEGTNIPALDSTHGSTLTIEGRDEADAPVTYYVRLTNYVTSTTGGVSHIELDFDTIMGGWTPTVPVFAGDIDRMYLSFVPADYDGSNTTFTTPQDASVSISNITVTGSVSTIISETRVFKGMYRFRTVDNAGDSVRIANLVLYNTANQPVPAMSPFASSTAVGAAANAFDSDVNSVWVSSTAEADSATVGFYAGSLDEEISSITLRADPSVGGGACMPTSFVIEYSNDGGSTWSLVFEQNGMAAFTDGETRNITVTINGSVDIGNGSTIEVNDNGDVLGY